MTKSDSWPAGGGRSWVEADPEVPWDVCWLPWPSVNKPTLQCSLAPPMCSPVEAATNCIAWSFQQVARANRHLLTVPITKVPPWGPGISIQMLASVNKRIWPKGRFQQALSSAETNSAFFLNFFLFIALLLFFHLFLSYLIFLFPFLLYFFLSPFFPVFLFISVLPLLMLFSFPYSLILFFFHISPPFFSDVFPFNILVLFYLS